MSERKLITVSIQFDRGTRYSAFTYGTKGENGKYYVSPDVVEKLLREAGCQIRGETWTLG